MTVTCSYKPFGVMLAEAGDRVGLSANLVLAWIVTCDGAIREKERDFLTEYLGVCSKEHWDCLFTAAQKGHYSDFLTACKILRTMDAEKKRLFMVMAIMTAMSDGVFGIPEIHVLCLVADVLGINLVQLNELFKEVAGRDIPRPGDLSHKDWWISREQNNSGRSGAGTGRHAQAKNKSKKPNKPVRPKAMSRIEALAILGLQEGAAAEEIKQAYRRLVNIHHPDKFHDLGSDAVKIATETFRQINQAYERLRNS